MAKNSEKEVVRELKSNVAKMALQKYERADLRTLTILHKHDLFQDIVPELDENLLEVLSTQDHPDKVSGSPGPLLFRYVSKDPVQLDVINVSLALFAPYIPLRKAAFDYLYTLKDHTKPYLLKRTIDLLASLKDVLFSEASGWHDAAVKLYDAINDDWFCTCAGFVQSFEKNFTEGIDDCLAKILRPSVSSVEPIEISVTAAREQATQIKSNLTDIIKANPDFVAALDEYMRFFGHVPLAKPYSMSEYVEMWQSAYKPVDDIWDTLWKWADLEAWPLRRYHVCTYFLYHPEKIPADKTKVLWDEIIEIIHMRKDEEDDLPRTQLWRCFSDLASHYCCYLETRLPYKDGERIAAQALWLAEQVCSLLPADADYIKHLRTESFAAEFVNCSNVWQLAAPPISPSFLRHMVANSSSPFSVSLLSALENGISVLSPRNLDNTNFDRVTNTILGVLLSIVPHKYIAPDKQVYAFERSCIGTARKWQGYVDKDSEIEAAFAVFIDAIEKLLQTTDVPGLLKKIPESNQGDQLLFAQYFANMVYVEDPPLDDIWKLLNDTDWRKAAFQSSVLSVFAILYKAFNEIESRFQLIQDRWTYNLPHYYAIACEEVDDEQRKALLFACVVKSSLCGNTVSGIEKLLKSENSFQYRMYIDQWTKHLQAALEWAPGWVRARIRPILVVLDS